MMSNTANTGNALSTGRLVTAEARRLQNRLSPLLAVDLAAFSALRARRFEKTSRSAGMTKRAPSTAKATTAIPAYANDRRK